MKKKIILTLTICLFAAGSIFNLNLTQSNQKMNISLENISVMAQASSDCPNGCLFKRGHCLCNGYHPFEEKVWEPAQ